MKNVCIEYAKVGDYLLPCLTPPESPKIGKYGRMCLRHLATHERAVYNGMLFDGTRTSIWRALINAPRPCWSDLFPR